MKEATSKPKLLKQNDIISFYHIQMPRWLFADKRYNRISLAAKVAYSLLLNRHQLSKLNGWVNDAGEVFVIFPRDELAGELQISPRKAVCVFKELADTGLVWETRRGHNKANLIYLTRVELSEDDAESHDSAPFAPELYADTVESGSADFACPDDALESEAADISFDTPSADYSEVQNLHVMTCDNCMSGGADSALHDMQDLHRSNTYRRYKEKSDTDYSQSVDPPRARNQDRRTDDEIAELDEILERSDLWTFPPATAKVFANAIERLYFTESYRIGNSILPQRKVRSHLHELDQMKLQTAERKIARNTEKEIRNTTAYTMAVIFNAIWESESDLLNDPYLNSLRDSLPPRNTCEGCDPDVYYNAGTKAYSFCPAKNEGHE